MKLFKKISNKNKMLISKGMENLSLVVSLIVSIMTYKAFPFPLVSSISLLAGTGIALGIEKMFGEKNKKNYSRELSNKYYLDNKDNIDVGKELKSINVLSRIRYNVKLTGMISRPILYMILGFMMVMRMPMANVVWGITFGSAILYNYIMEKIDFSNETVTRVIEMVRNAENNVVVENEDEMDKTIERRLNPLNLKYSYVPLASQGMKVSVPEVSEVISNLDDYKECGRGYARRRIKEDKNRNLE